MLQTEKRTMREDKILSSLDNLTYATRKQLQIINKLGGDRNAHRVLQRMEKDKSISSIRTEFKVYYLSNDGKERIGSKQGDLKRAWITHTLMRNDLYIDLGMPKSWQKEIPIKFNGENKYLIPDAMYNIENKLYFIEVDNQQAMKTNYEKIDKYVALFKPMFRQYQEHPTLIWKVASNARKDKIKKACGAVGIKFDIY